MPQLLSVDIERGCSPQRSNAKSSLQTPRPRLHLELNFGSVDIFSQGIAGALENPVESLFEPTVFAWWSPAQAAPPLEATDPDPALETPLEAEAPEEPAVPVAATPTPARAEVKVGRWSKLDENRWNREKLSSFSFFLDGDEVD